MKLDRCDRHRNRLNPSPNKLSADFICRRSKLFRVESLDKGYSDCLYLSRQIRFSTDGPGIFPTFFNNRNNSVVRKLSRPFNIYKHFIKTFQHEPHSISPCAIRELAGVYGYTIHIDTDDRTPREIVLLPAAWLPPIRLKEVEGRLTDVRPTASNCGCCTPGQLPSERRNEVVEPNGTATLRSLFTQLSTDPEGHSRRKPHRPTRIGSHTPHGEILPNGQSRRHHLFLGTRTPRTAAIGPFRCRLRIFEKAKGSTPPTARHRRPHGISDRTQSSTLNPFSHDIHLCRRCFPP